MDYDVPKNGSASHIQLLAIFHGDFPFSVQVLDRVCDSLPASAWLRTLSIDVGNKTE
jgi:hypothetical protein